MSRMAYILARRNRVEWDHPAPDTRLLPNPFPKSTIVPPGPLAIPTRMSIKPSAPSQLLPSGVISESQALLRLPRTVDARVYPRKFPDCALRGAVSDACPDSPQKKTHGQPLRVSPSAVDACPGSPQMYSHSQLPLRASSSAVDARALARMFFRPAVPGVEMDACAKAQAISHVPALDAPAHAVEGALALPFISFFPFHFDIHKGACLVLNTIQPMSHN